MNNPRRMSGWDSLFLSVELPEQPMQSMIVAVLRPPEGDGERRTSIGLDDVRRHVACRLDALPALRLCVKPIPFGLHHPVFVEACDLDLDYHVGRATLPAPGGSGELDRLYASLAERRLDRRRPLWHLTLVDGLDGGRQALLLQVHHCLMDGTAFLNLLSKLFSTETAQPNGPTSGWLRARAQGRWRMVAHAIADHGRGIAQLPALIRKTNRGIAAGRKATASATIAVPKPKVDVPLCSLNFGYTSGRRFARAILPLTEVELVKKLAEVTTNDVVLCVVAGALREYLQRRHDLPDRPLVANVPVGIKAPGDHSRAVGNHITGFTTSLATNVADPWVRLETITAVTRESKRRLVHMGRKVVGEWLDLIPPAIFSSAVRRNSRRRRNHPDYLDANVTITSIRGPMWPCYFGSAVVEEMYPTAPPNSGVGVTFAVWDYADALMVGILSFADTVEDPGELARGLSRSLSELVAIARCRQGDSALLAGAAGAHVARGDRW